MGLDAARVQKDEQKRIDDADQLTDEEIAEKEKLLTEVILFQVCVVAYEVERDEC